MESSLQVQRIFKRVSKRDFILFFFFQAEDGIRDYKVTGVQTCALPIYVLLQLTARRLPSVHRPRNEARARRRPGPGQSRSFFEERCGPAMAEVERHKIGRASCRERV